ncbi:MAG: penicillin-binding protein 2 [Alphaproteobacteria bacterium]|jgi:cell division protein FtsI (penicillin-binding protein 3)|nr:penicillin-binding protein 2 [Alphaproteobacteria bacterium]
MTPPVGPPIARTPAPIDPHPLPRAEARYRFRGRAAQALEMGRSRLMVTGLVFALAFLAIGGRLVDLVLFEGGREPHTARAAERERPVRADIVDRNGVLLATSLPTASLYADATQVPDPAAATRQLAGVLDGLDRARTEERLASDRRFVWLERHLTPRQQAAINRLGIPGLGFEREERRAYPLGSLTAHIVGFTDIDGHGLAGIEASLDDRLEDGAGPVALSIDTRLQSILREELSAAIAEYSAIGGAGLIMDARTGELLAMVSLPDFNPVQAGRVDDDARFNRTTLGLYEMGSTFKIFTTAMALDSGTVRLTDAFDARHPIRIGRHTISDFHAEARWLTVPEIFRHSSNIGAVRMALAVGTPGQQDYLRRLGLLEPAAVELPEVGHPQVPSPWREINTMTISFGHGLSVTPVNLATAVSAVVNGGVRHEATLLLREPGAPASGTQVLAPSTSDTMRRLLRLVVEEGTGRRADAPGYLVGGKTGTAEKSAGGGYSRRRLLSSFIAAFPMTNPDYVVFAMLDEPQGTAETYGYATGGWVAAPVVRRVVARMGPLMGMAPFDPEAPEIREAMHLNIGPADNQFAEVSLP